MVGKERDVVGAKSWTRMAQGSRHAPDRCALTISRHWVRGICCPRPVPPVRRSEGSTGPEAGSPWNISNAPSISRQETDIEHMVETSEAHDSGLCVADAGTKRRFASDLLNRTLAEPGVNRHQKSGKNAGEWLPRMNQWWFAERVVTGRRLLGRHKREAVRNVSPGNGYGLLGGGPKHENERRAS